MLSRKKVYDTNPDEIEEERQHFKCFAMSTEECTHAFCPKCKKYQDVVWRPARWTRPILATDENDFITGVDATQNFTGLDLICGICKHRLATVGKFIYRNER